MTPAQGPPGRVAVGQDTTVQRAFNEAESSLLYYGDDAEAQAGLKHGDGERLPTMQDRDTRPRVCVYESNWGVLAADRLGAWD